MLNFSPQQKQIITQMEAHLGLDPKDVSLDESNELFFNVSALSLLRMRLAPDIMTFSIHSPEFDSQLQILSSAASLTLADGRGANAVKSAQVGEILHDNVTIKNLTEAENIANSRAARAVLRMIAFEPVKEFQNYLASTATTREIETISQPEKDRRFIHKIRDDQDMDETTSPLDAGLAWTVRYCRRRRSAGG